jgi:hypothetical protein
MISRSIIRPYPTGACGPSTEELNAIIALVLDPNLKTERLDQNELTLTNRYVDWPARIQGQRQTCIAFAAAACVELLRAGDGQPFEALSPQFLYWHMRDLGQRLGDSPPGWKEGATKLGHAKQVLQDIGICRWVDCPYPDRLDDQDLKEGEEPDLKGPKPEENLVTRRISRDSYYEDWSNPNNHKPVARTVYDALKQNGPVAIALPVFYSASDPLETNWDNPVTTNSGVVIDPIEGEWVPHDPARPEHSAPGHAVCVVGFQPDADELSGGWFIFRNSRGINWAGHRDGEGPEPPIVPARGYGAISATYVDRYCWEMLSPVLP